MVAVRCNRLHPQIIAVTARLAERSGATRASYLARMRTAHRDGAARGRLGCTNRAHGFAAAGTDQDALRALRWPAIAIVSAYNDLLSAHQPLERYPGLIKRAAREAGAIAQFAGGVPAMCDGITQGRAGMELSLFSRDVIAMSTAIALSHDLFDAVLCLGVCDKIVPGLLRGALAFGHLPAVFVPAGPMPSGLSNGEKARIRQRHAAGEIDEEGLLDSEARSYHAPGTCTFYGTANSNQMLMEILGLHLPGAAFVPPNTPLRDALTQAAARRVAAITTLGPNYTPLCDIVDERAIVNAIVGLLATGGSTNHTIHLIAIAQAAGLQLNWDDFNDLSAIVPLLTRIYPNGTADVNAFHAAGGMGFLIRELLQAGLLHTDTRTIMGRGLAAYAQAPALHHGQLVWEDAPAESLDSAILRPARAPFSHEGGLRLLTGNLGRAVIKTSAVAPEHRCIEAPARIFESQEAVIEAFSRGELNRDAVVVVRFQGPRANGMPELHALTPALSVLQKRGLRVALVTDGRMSGASGSVPAAIHLSPEALAGGALARVRDGDIIRLDSLTGRLEALVPVEEWANRTSATVPTLEHCGLGRELFASFRAAVGDAEFGAIACNQ